MPRTLSRMQRSLPIGTAIVFGFLLLFGGGGAPAPLIHSVLQAVGCAALVALIGYHFYSRPISTEIRWSGILILLVLLIPVVQLIPIPFELWRSLPGREEPARILELAGLGGGWRPLSLDPESTRFAALSLVPALVVYLAVSGLTLKHRVLLIKIAIAVALVSGIVAACQFVAPGTRSLYLYPRAIFTQASGLFANRNFQSDLMLLAILFTSYVIKTSQPQLKLWLRGRQWRVHLTAMLIPFFAVMVIATRSRTGALMLGPILLVAFLIASNLRFRLRLLIGAALAALILVLISVTQFATEVFERFALFDKGELRFSVLPDLIHAIGLYFPVGAGLGTFDPVYRTVESLEVVRESYLNHAHDDYLEIAIETGILGLALVALFVAAYVARVWRIFRVRPVTQQVLLQRVAAVGIAVILVHSIADYPLRTITLLSLFSFLCAALFTEGPSGTRGTAAVAKDEGAKAPPRRTLLSSPLRRGLFGIALLLLGAAVVVPTLTIGFARQAVMSGLGTLAYNVRPTNARAAALAAGELLQAGEAGEAARLAAQAISNSPIDVVAVRTLGMALNQQRRGSGEELMLAAAHMGWRDTPTQIWVLERALQVGEFTMAFQRAEALVRRSPTDGLAFSILRLLATHAQSRDLLVGSLAAQPYWRNAFLVDGTDKPARQLEALAQVLEALKRAHSAPTVTEARDTIDQLVLSGRALRGYQLYAGLFGTGATRASLLRDSGFERRDTDYQPAHGNTLFDWRVHSSENVQVGIENELGRDNRLLFVVGGRQEAPFAERMMVLPPGRYRLSYRVSADERNGPEGFRWLIQCMQPDAAILDDRGRVLAGGEWERRAADFSIPQGCPAQRLMLVAAPLTDVTGREARYDDVAIVARAE